MMLMPADWFGALAVIVNFIGYRQNDVNRYRLISGIALVSVGIHFFLIDAMAAGIACFLAFTRNMIAMRTQHVSVVVVFVLIHIGFLAWEWFWLQHSWIIFVAYGSSIIFTVGSVALKSAESIRRWFVLAELLGLMYSVLVGSLFGTLFNTTNLISIFIKELQERKRRQKA